MERCDFGVENIEVACYMIYHRGVGCSSIITGSSTHNDRVKEVFKSYIKIYSGKKQLHFLAQTTKT